MTPPKGKVICLKGWQVTGIGDAIKMTSKNLPTLDPFDDIDPLCIENEVEEVVNAQAIAANLIYVTEENHADDSDNDDDKTDVEMLFEDEYDETEDDDDDDETDVELLYEDEYDVSEDDDGDGDD